MLNPIMLTVSHTEPVHDPRDFGDALDRVASALFYMAGSWRFDTDGRKARVRILEPEGDTPMLLVGSLLCRGRDIPDPDNDDEWMPLIAAAEPTA